MVAEKHSRQRRDHEWRGIPESQRVHERHFRESIEETEHCADGKYRSQQVPRSFPGAERPDSAEAWGDDEQQRDRDQAAHEDELLQRIALQELLRRQVEKQAAGHPEHEPGDRFADSVSLSFLNHR